MKVISSKTTMLERVRETITRYNMLPKGSRVAVAVSGGADSICLLHVLTELAGDYELALSVAHFNHQLRGAESDQDERTVAELARRLGLPFRRASAEVSAMPGNLEQAARRARHAFFAHLMAAEGMDRVALGHTRDDQAETVMFRFLRGASLAGLAGIHPVTTYAGARPTLIRPLIDVTRDEVEQFLRSRGIKWRDDSSNQDLRFARNRIRRLLLPQLAEEWNPAIRESLAHVAQLAQEEEHWWRSHIDTVAAAILERRDDGVEFRTGNIAGLPLAIKRRVIRHAIALVKGDLRGLDYVHFERVLALTERLEGDGGLRLPGSIAVRRSFDWVRIEHLDVAVLASEFPPIPLRVPGTYPIPGGTVIHVEVSEGPRPHPPRPESPHPKSKNDTLRAAELNWVRLPATLELRGWQAGDGYCPEGQLHRRKVKEMFQMARIPSWRRRSWPIVSSEAGIVWTRGFGPAREFAAGPGTRGSKSSKVLRVWEADAEAGEL
jgi:tRNA(Ile)-lysidine synthase